jgi:hypothetical protein
MVATRAAQAEPTGAQLPVAFEQGLGLITVDGSLMLRAASFKRSSRTAAGVSPPIRTTAEMVQKAQLQEAQ